MRSILLKLSGILENANPNKSQGGYWVSPEWEVYPSDYGYHREFIKAIGSESENELYDAGWIKVTWYEHAFMVFANKIDETKLNKILRIVSSKVGDVFLDRNMLLFIGVKDFPNLMASPELVEEYGNVWQALVRGREINPEIITHNT